MAYSRSNSLYFADEEVDKQEHYRRGSRSGGGSASGSARGATQLADILEENQILKRRSSINPMQSDSYYTNRPAVAARRPSSRSDDLIHAAESKQRAKIGPITSDDTFLSSLPSKNMENYLTGSFSKAKHRSASVAAPDTLIQTESHAKAKQTSQRISHRHSVSIADQIQNQSVKFTMDRKPFEVAKKESSVSAKDRRSSVRAEERPPAPTDHHQATNRRQSMNMGDIDHQMQKAKSNQLSWSQRIESSKPEQIHHRTLSSTEDIPSKDHRRLSMNMEPDRRPFSSIEEDRGSSNRRSSTRMEPAVNERRPTTLFSDENIHAYPSRAASIVDSRRPSVIDDGRSSDRRMSASMQSDRRPSSIGDPHSSNDRRSSTRMEPVASESRSDVYPPVTSFSDDDAHGYPSRSGSSVESRRPSTIDGSGRRLSTSIQSDRRPSSASVSNERRSSTRIEPASTDNQPVTLFSDDDINAYPSRSASVIEARRPSASDGSEDTDSTNNSDRYISSSQPSSVFPFLPEQAEAFARDLNASLNRNFLDSTDNTTGQSNTLSADSLFGSTNELNQTVVLDRSGLPVFVSQSSGAMSLADIYPTRHVQQNHPETETSMSETSSMPETATEESYNPMNEPPTIPSTDSEEDHYRRVDHLAAIARGSAYEDAMKRYIHSKNNFYRTSQKKDEPADLPETSEDVSHPPSPQQSKPRAYRKIDLVQITSEVYRRQQSSSKPKALQDLMKRLVFTYSVLQPFS
jgi:ribosomal protein L22